MFRVVTRLQASSLAEISGYIWHIGGKYVPAGQGTLPVTDLALARGYGVFDYWRSYGGKYVQMERNLDRFRRSATRTELPLPWSNQELSDIVLETSKRNNFDDCAIRMFATGGSASDCITPETDPLLVVMCTPALITPPEWNTQGTKIVTFHSERWDPETKSINYLPAILGKKKAAREGGVEALYVDKNGYTPECTTSNVFAFFHQPDGKCLIVTPDSGILHGITRGRVLEILAENDVVAVEKRPIRLEELLQADEVCICSASRGVLPVVQIDGNTISTGQVGPHSKQLLDDFLEYMLQHGTLTWK
eukprot:TRINITY_DN75119_c0_g1_i1.p1 TRINITY_DN75119_c0_g1~~TRINITY_DN75119_c0_g1_i1.p1  ORF type:complete len:306 (-),score=28.17 TRINITY_DN75119_c0_g1_i1:133-1050(-)